MQQKLQPKIVYTLPVSPSAPPRAFRAAASTPALRACLSRAHAAATAEHGDLGCSQDALRVGFLLAATRHLAWANLEPTAERVLEFAERAAVSDLVVALACDAGSEAAWSYLHAVYFPRLAGAAVRRGLGGEAAETAACGLLGDLALPGPNDRAATLIGTFDGVGSLWGWLRVILARRLSKPPPKSRPRPIGDAGADLPAHTAVRAHAVPDPLEHVAGREAGALLLQTLMAVWRTLTAEEALALQLKVRDGRKQNEIAQVMGVPSYQITRLIQRAIGKLQRAVDTAFGAGAAAWGDPSQPPWDELLVALTSHFANQGGRQTPARMEAADEADG